MRVLVVGGGGREHVLAWKIRQSPLVEHLLCAPGNAGTSAVAQNVAVADGDIEGLAKLCKKESIDLCVVGPEVPLAAGLADRLRKDGVKVFGPGAAGAKLESSKSYAKHLMQHYVIPTAPSRAFDDFDSAREYLEAQQNFPVVLKADGLAAGKGVVLPENLDEALTAAHEMLEGGRFGDAGRKLLVEEHMRGEEVSVLALTDGKTLAVMEPAQDHKRIFDGDQGPNTGGMGAYSPAPVADEALLSMVTREVLVRIIHALARERVDYRGVVYAGLMATRGGPRVIEFNCRFGDPEAQVIIPRLKSDLVPLLVACADGKLNTVPDLEWDPRPAVCVVMASGGYPQSSSKGDVIEGLEAANEMEDVIVFHAGTARVGNEVVTAGGRVLGVTALGDTIEAARDRAYEAVAKIRFEGMQFRRDIAARALAR